jgi:hypothetical protein
VVFALGDHEVRIIHIDDRRHVIRAFGSFGRSDRSCHFDAAAFGVKALNRIQDCGTWVEVQCVAEFVRLGRRDRFDAR